MNITKQTAQKLIETIDETEILIIVDKNKLLTEIEQILIDYSNKCLDIAKHF